ncbi:MAG TPA: hypothetical protein V6C81_18300 [Planktothrix sp.]
MKTDRPWQFVVLLHLALLVAGACLGVFLAGANHSVLGASLGSFIGVNIPGVYGHLALKFGRAKGDVTRLCGAVFTNEWIANEEMRTAIQNIRGENIIVWFGLFCTSLLAVFAWHMTEWHCLAVSLGGALGAWLLSKFA